MKKETWKTIIQVIVSILTAALTALGTTSCMGHGPIILWRRYAQKKESLAKKPGSLFWVSGAGGSRTLVQTGKPYAFYTLILVFVFVLQQDPSHQLQPYPLRFHPAIEAW